MTQAKGFGRYSPDIHPEIQVFQEACYPERNREEILPMWRWLLIDSASRLGVEPYVWVYWKNGRIMAHQGAIAVRVKVETEHRTTGWFVETMAHADVRGSPVGPMLVKRALQDLPFNLSLGQTDYMRELQFRLGWQHVTDLRRWVLAPTSVPSLAALPAPMARLVSMGLAIWHRTRLFIHGVGIGTDFNWTPVSRFGEHHTELWDRVSSKFRCAVVRDAAYLNWKYLDRPNSNFQGFELTRGGQCVAVAVLQIAPPSPSYPYTRGHLVDFVCDPDERQGFNALMWYTVRTLLRGGARVVNVLAAGEVVCTRLRSFGFIEREARHNLLVATTEDDPLASTIRDPQAWYLTGGDSDVDQFLG